MLNVNDTMEMCGKVFVLHQTLTLFPIHTGKWYFQTHYTLLDRSSQHQLTQLHMRDTSVLSVGHHVELHFRHGCLHGVM